MSVNIEMPKLSDTMTEGTLIKWHKKVGDSVETGDILAEIETDKATMEMEAFDDGVLTEILIPDGGKAAVGANVALILAEGETAEAQAAAPKADKKTDEKAPEAKSEDSKAAPAPSASVDNSRVKASP